MCRLRSVHGCAQVMSHIFRLNRGIQVGSVSWEECWGDAVWVRWDGAQGVSLGQEGLQSGQGCIEVCKRYHRD